MYAGMYLRIWWWWCACVCVHICSCSVSWHTYTSIVCRFSFSKKQTHILFQQHPNTYECLCIYTQCEVTYVPIYYIYVWINVCACLRAPLCLRVLSLHACACGVLMCTCACAYAYACACVQWYVSIFHVYVYEHNTYCQQPAHMRAFLTANSVHIIYMHKYMSIPNSVHIIYMHMYIYIYI